MTQRDFDNVLSGPWRVQWGGVDLGHTVGETRLSIAPRLLEIRDDAHGGVTDLIHTDDEVTIRLRLAEWTAASLVALAPAIASVSGGLGIGADGGTRLAAGARQLALHPIEAGDDTTRDITLWKTVACGPADLHLAPDADTTADITFRALPDSDAADGARFGRIGAA